MNLCNLLKTAHSVQRCLIREYAFKSNLKIKWVRPEKIPCYKPEKSGDLSKLPPVNPQEYIPGYEKSKELKTADPSVQALFQLGNNPKRETHIFYKQAFVKQVQRHPLDYGSMEAILARMTATIRRLQVHMEEFPRDAVRKVILKELIEKRKKFLKHLRRWDYRRFEWILEKLDLVYKPAPAENLPVTRKDSLRKLTNIHCEKLRQERLAEYRKQLEAKQIPFMESAIKKLEFVRQEQIDLDIPITVTEEHIAEYKKQLDELKKSNEFNESKEISDDIRNKVTYDIK